MDKRKKIAIIAIYNEKWIGGTYYIINIINSFELLPEQTKPTIDLYVKNTNAIEEFKKLIFYTNLNFIIINNNVSLLKKINYKIKEHFPFLNIPKYDFIFPDPNLSIFPEGIKNGIYWIPDFQDIYLPKYFQEDELKNRKKYRESIISTKNPIVLSSFDALNTFKKLYPNAIDRVKVIPFAVSNYQKKLKTKAEIQSEFEIKQNYFICPNQLWAHKNHIVLLKSILLSATKPYIVFTGKLTDNRGEAHIKLLLEFIDEHNLHNHIKFLGFIDRIDLLSLIKNAIAVVQPSLFEGWSTVIEDAKSLNKMIVASNISVHQEQLENYPIKHEFFNPHDASDLAEKLLMINDYNREDASYNYKKNILDFANRFISIK